MEAKVDKPPALPGSDNGGIEREGPLLEDKKDQGPCVGWAM